MIIEFFGFPGSGKTTTMNQLVKELENQNQPFVKGTFDHYSTTKRIILKLIWSFQCLIYNPKFYTYNICYFFKSGNSFKNKTKDFLNLTYLYARYAHYKNSKRIIIFDQGLVQAYFSLMCFNPNYKKYNRKLLIKNSDYNVLLNLSLDKSIERIQKRDTRKSRIETDRGIDYKFIENQFLKLKYILLKSPIKIVEIEAVKGKSVNAGTIIRKIKYQEQCIL